MELVNRAARNRGEYRRMSLYTWAACAAASIAAVALLFTAWLFAVRAGDAGMAPTVEQNDVILFDRLSKTFRTPRRGDIVAFTGSLGEGVYLGRVVGLPGETVTIRAGDVYINGLRLDEPYAAGDCADMESAVVREGCFFVMPDQREQADCAAANNLTVSARRILGRALARVWPWERTSLFVE